MTELYEIVVEGIKSILPVPVPLPKRGDVYESRICFHTPAKKVYCSGDRFMVLERVHPDKNLPFDRQSTLGGLVIDCKYFRSYWVCFDQMVAEGSVVLVAEAQPITFGESK